jgi:hypothetical protein
MSAHHLSCQGCRIRLRATGPNVDLLEGMCPICGAGLQPAACALDVMGFRSFDLGALSEDDYGEPSVAVAQAIDLRVRREAGLVRDDFDAERWLDESGKDSGAAVAKWPAER